MRLKRVEKFTKAVTKGLLPTPHLTLSQAIEGLLVWRCLILTEIARCFQTGVAFAHNLKRVFRFVSNERLTAEVNKEVLASRLVGQLRHRLKPKQHLEVIVDWTRVWPYQVLSALIPWMGVPSWVQIALHLLRQSTKYLNLLFDNKAGCFSLHRV